MSGTVEMCPAADLDEHVARVVGGRLVRDHLDNDEPFTFGVEVAEQRAAGFQPAAEREVARNVVARVGGHVNAADAHCSRSRSRRTWARSATRTSPLIDRSCRCARSITCSRRLNGTTAARNTGRCCSLVALILQNLQLATIPCKKSL